MLPQQPIKFRAKWSPRMIGVTIITLTVIIVAEYILLEQVVLNFDIVLLFVAFFLLILSIGFALYIPIYITLTPQNFTCRIVYKKINIPIVDIATIEPFDFNNSWRVFGSGGYMGYLGIFANKKVGRYSAYVTNPHFAFIIFLKNGEKFVFSDNHRDSIISYIKNSPFFAPN
jgi:hypothetical protein